MKQARAAKRGQNGPFLPILRVVEAVKGLDPIRYGLISPPHTLMWISSEEIHLDPVKKMVLAKDMGIPAV